MTEIQSDIDGDWVSSDTVTLLEPPPDHATAAEEQTQPVVPPAPPASVVGHQPHQLDPCPPQPAASTNTTTTTYVTVTETRTRERSCCEDTYCQRFILRFYVPTSYPGPGPGADDSLPPTTACCEGGFGITRLGCLFRCGWIGYITALEIFLAIVSIACFIIYLLLSYNII